MDKIKVSDIRAKFPMYADLSDDDLLIGIRKKYYSDIPMKQFVARIDYDTDRQKYSPAKDSFFGNIPAAYGGGVASIARAVGAQPLLNRVGLDSLPQSKDEAAQLDEPLNNAPGGTTGRVLGAMSVLAPSAAIPGANTMAGAAAIGGGVGAATTEGGLLDRLKGGMWGAGGGVAGNLLGRGISAGVGGFKGLVEPFTQTGRERIAGRTLERFATNPSAIAAAPTGPTITGAMPTLAEATKDTGLATLERAIATMSPEAAEQLLARAQANNAARINALQQVAGNAPVPSRVGRLSRIASGQNTASATAARTSAANASYGAARRAGVSAPMAEALEPQIASLMRRPSMQQAQAVARRLAAEEDLELANTGSAQGLQYMKQALDDMIGRLRPEQRNELRLLTQTSNDLKSVLDEVVPALRVADAEFRNLSVPVNRAAVGDRLAESTSSAIRDLSGNRPLQAHAFSRALNNEEQLIRQATGFRGSSLDDFMTPSQMQRINAVRDELETVSNLSRAANGAGSQTAKMLASQNLVRRVAGPLGLPESWIESTISKEMMRAPQFLAKSAEEQIQTSVVGGLLSPFEGQRLLAIAQKANPTKSEAALLTKALGSGLLGYSAAQYATQ